MRTRGLTLLEALFLLHLVAMLVAYGALSRRVFERRSESERCRKNLQTLALAAIEYTDDHRFFPHSCRIPELAPGVESDESALAVRLLHHFDYLEGARPFVCPGSGDMAVDPRPMDAPLASAVDLSYGYTRRGLCTGSMSSSLLFGDKARFVAELAELPERAGHMSGNHSGYMNVACLDGHVQRITPSTDSINTHNIADTTRRSGGFLGVLPD